MSLSKNQVNGTWVTPLEVVLWLLHTHVCVHVHTCMYNIYTIHTQGKKYNSMLIMSPGGIAANYNINIWDKLANMGCSAFLLPYRHLSHWYWNLLKPVFQLLLFFERTYYHMAMNSRSFCLVPSTGIAVLGPGHFNLAFLKAMGLLLYPQFMHT